MTKKITLTYLFLSVLLILFSSCSSTKEISSWRKPETQQKKFQKVLVIGMINSLELRTTFESKLSTALNKKGIQATGSLAFFGDDLLEVPENIEAWKPLITELKSDEFDAVLVTKVVGVEGKDSDSGIVRYYNEFFASFEEDLMKNKNIYSEEEGFKDFQVHQVASNLYCLCERDLEEDLIWKINIELKQAFDTDYLVEEGIRLFSKKFIEELKEEDLFIEKN